MPYVCALPFHVSCSEPSVSLFLLADGRFQLTKDGPIAPFMSGPGYFLVENDLAHFLEDLNIPDIRFDPAVIWHRSRDLEYLTHTNLLIERYFTPDTISELDLTGEKFYSMNDNYLFVSPALKRLMERGSFQYLHFSEGLSDFV